MSLKNITIIALISSAALVAGCSADAGTGESNDTNGPNEPLGVSREALTGLVTASWGGIGSDTFGKFASGASSVLDLGVDGNWICWLTGIRGSLTGSATVEVYRNLSTDAQLGVKVGNWALYIDPEKGMALEGNAVCTSNLNDVGDEMFFGGAPPETLVTNANRDLWFGLRGIVGGGLANASDFAMVTNNGTSPQIVPGAPEWIVSSQGTNVRVGGAAAGIPFTPHVSGIWVYHDNGVGTVPLHRSDGTPLPSGTVCFLTSLKGTFTTSSFADGVFIERDNSGDWSMTATSGKSGRALCIL